MYIIYSTEEVSLLFSIIPEQLNAFVPSWHGFKNFVAEEIELLICNEKWLRSFTS
jgi:hypothetical protein